MNIYIFDTNLFFNLEVETDFGKNPYEIMTSITDYARALRGAGKAAFYMPPRIVEEIYTFVPETDERIQKLLAEVVIKAPESDKMTFGAGVFYEIVQDIRNRSYRGLQVAEEELKNVANDTHLIQDNLSHIDSQKALGVHITRLRERYRTATRVKFLDSLADLDIIALAYELEGNVVSADEGVIQWARKFGVREVFPHVLKHQLDSLLQA